MSETHLSRAAYERLKAKLEDFSTRGRVDIARTIQTARQLGDLSENADYHAAREDQGRMEPRIRQLTQLLDKAVIIDEGRGTGAATNGSIVALRYQGDDEVERYLIGSIEERRDDGGHRRCRAGTGAAGPPRRRPGQYQAPRGALTVEIVEIEG